MMLDEPTTGVDPVSRRFMWGVINNMRNTAVVLTTHSMEECEALCNRITVMVGGRLRCHGTAQHLKSKYGRGFMVDVKMLAPTAEEIADTIRRSNLAQLDSDEVNASILQASCA